jgi:DNA-binding transcriptional LysR family regulator
VRLEQLEQFLALSKFRHFKQAAEFCNLSTSALTRSIQTLEQELNCELVMRSTRSVAITKAGDLFINYCNNTLDQHQVLKQEIKSLAHNNNQKIIIGVTENTAHFTPFVCDKFMADFPELEIEIQQPNNHELSNKLALSQLDMIIDSSTPLSKDSLINEQCVYLPEQVLMFTHKNHPLASLISIDKPAIVPFPVLGCFSKNLPIQKMLQASARSINKLENMKVGTFDQIIGYLDDYQHIALAGIEYTHAIESNPDLVFIKPENQYQELNLSIEVAKSKTHNPHVAKLLSYINEETKI